MRAKQFMLIGALALGVVTSSGLSLRAQKAAPKALPAGSAQRTPAPAVVPATALKDGWEEIDERLLFLMVRLANVEASLDAIERDVRVRVRERTAKLGNAKRAEQGNEMMDRKGGGPMKWSEFYGTTAEKFFYHPTDRNSTYHTVTVLGQKTPQADNRTAEGVPSRQGLPVHQRPPQFDYIYRANRDAQARAEKEAAELRSKVDELLARRASLEEEQSALWCEIAFRAVSRHDLPKRPIYRFELASDSADKADQQRADAIKAAASFVQTALSIVSQAQKSQASTFANIQTTVTDARDKFDDAWIRLAVLPNDTRDIKTTAGKFAALAKRLDDVTHNLSDSYRVSIDGDRFKDEQRKDTFRALLQDSLVSYAQIVLALDEMLNLMATEWRIQADLERPVAIPVVGNQREQTTTPQKAGNTNTENKNGANTKFPDSVPPLTEIESVRNAKSDIRVAMRTTVSLKSPYKPAYAGAPTHRISVQYAAMDVLQQIGLELDFKKSQANVGAAARRWITPNIADEPCDSALTKILSPLDLSYDVENGKVVLKRK